MSEMNETERAEKIAAGLKLAAAKALMIDPDDALALVDVSAMRVEADGTIRGAVEVIAQLKIDKPHLFGKHARDMTPQEATTKLNELRRGPPPAKMPTDKRASDMTKAQREQWVREHTRRFG